MKYVDTTKQPRWIHRLGWFVLTPLILASVITAIWQSVMGG